METSTEPILTVEQIARSYGRIKVLSDITFSLHKGEIAAITGENGSGKSTLLNILAGRLSADQGSISCSGRIGFCPQEPHLFDSLTVQENIRYFASAYGLREGWEHVSQRLLESFRFVQFQNRLVSQLSGGTRQKLNLCLAFLPEPDILILDEPYSGFDWETYLYFWEFASDLRKEGRSFLIVSHFVHERARFDTIWALSAGELRCD